MIAQELSVRLQGERVGALVRFDDDRILFAFDQAYVERADRHVLSLSFMDESGGIRDDLRTTTRRAPPYFSNLLPEGHLREYLAASAGVNESRDYPLLELTGGDLPGAVEVVAESPPITAIAAGAGADGREDEVAADGALRFSLAGIQLKLSAVMEAAGGLTVPARGMGGDWILKLPSASYTGMPENEYSMMKMASMAGIETADVELVRMERIGGIPAELVDEGLEGRLALAVRRFDRPGKGRRIHTEDFAQVFGVYPQRKYDRYGYIAIGRVLATYSNEAAVDQFARRLIYGAMIGNADLHLKNWSLIYRNGTTPELAPAYDLLATVAHLPDPGMALRLAPRAKRWNELTTERFASLASAMGVSRNAVLRPVAETVERFHEVWEREKDHLPLSQRVAAAISRQLTIVPAAARLDSRRSAQR